MSGLRITDPVRLLVLRAAVAAGGASAALTSHVLHCDSDELAGAADECIELLLQATAAAIDAAGVLPGEDQRGRLRIAIADYVDQPGEPGRCRICGCDDDHACVNQVPIVPGSSQKRNCSWADHTRTLCDNPTCLEKAGVTAPELVS